MGVETIHRDKVATGSRRELFVDDWLIEDKLDGIAAWGVRSELSAIRGPAAIRAEGCRCSAFRTPYDAYPSPQGVKMLNIRAI